MVKKVGKYEIGKTLGEGTFGKVKFAVNTETGDKVAIKILDKEKIQKQNMGAQIKKEISIMKMVKHETVVKLFEVLASRTKIFIVLELITGGELFDKIVAEGRFDENTARFYYRQLIKGMKYCHGQGVCHRDLKPENLLLDQNGNLKISDFGLSALYTGSADDEGRATLLHTTCGTPNYVAPEVLNDKGYDGRAADIWSCGVILYVLLAGFLPFDEPHMSALFRKIQKAEFTYPSWFSPQIRSLLDTILVPDPLKRATLAQIEAHPWFIGPDNYKDNNLAFSTPEAAAAAGVAFEGSIEDAVVHEDEAAADPKPRASAPAGAAGSPALMRAPSARDIEEAVEDVPETAVTTGQKVAKEAGAPARSLNAFDLINMFGGMALNRLIQTDKKAAAICPQFLTAATPDAVLTRLETLLKGMGAEVKVDRAGWKLKARIGTPKGEVGVSTVVAKMTDSLHLVETHRGKGDILEYNAVYARLREQMADLMHGTR